MNLEAEWERYQQIEKEVFPSGSNPPNLPGWKAVMKLEELDRREKHLLQCGAFDVGRKKKSDPYKTVRELDILAELGGRCRVRHRY